MRILESYYTDMKVLTFDHASYLFYKKFLITLKKTIPYEINFRQERIDQELRKDTLEAGIASDVFFYLYSIRQV